MILKIIQMNTFLFTLHMIHRKKETFVIENVLPSIIKIPFKSNLSHEYFKTLFHSLLKNVNIIIENENAFRFDTICVVFVTFLSCLGLIMFSAPSKDYLIFMNDPLSSLIKESTFISVSDILLHEVVALK